MKKLLIAAALASTALAGAAFAAQDAAVAPGQHMPMHADVNQDGVATRNEAGAAADAEFARLDTNHDGKLSKEELAAARPMRGAMHGPMGGHAPMAGMDYDGPGGPGGGMRARMMERFDTNHDGKIDDAERAAAHQAMLDRFDTDHDGKLSPTERQAAHAAMRAQMGGAPGADAPPPPPPSPHARKNKMREMMFERIDTDHDGAVSQPEFRAVALKHFDKVDTNHDGKIDQAERDAAHQRIMQRMHRLRGMHRPHGPGDMPPPPPGDAPDAPQGE